MVRKTRKNIVDSKVDLLANPAESFDDLGQPAFHASHAIAANAVNSSAVIGGDLTGSVKEDEITVITGQLTIDDVDGEREFKPIVDALLNYGHFSLTADGAWTYKLTKYDAIPGWFNGNDKTLVEAKDGTTIEITINVKGTNDLPVFTGTMSGSATEGYTYTPTLTASDPDDPFLSFSVGTPEHGTVLGRGSDWFKYTSGDFYGVDRVPVVVYDQNGGSTSSYFYFNVTNEPDAPFGAEKSITVAEDGSRALAVDDFGFSDYKDAGSDINSFDAAIISAVSGAGKLWLGDAELDLSNSEVRVSKADIEAGKLVWKPDTDANGASATAQITFKVKDDDSEDISFDNTSFSSYTLTINVAAVNDAPTFSGGANQSVAEDSGSHMVSNWATSISAGPSDESAQILSFKVTNNKAAMFAEAPTISPDGTLRYKLADNAFGTANVSVVLKDDGSGAGDNTSDAVTFTITAEGSPDAPKLTSPNKDSEVRAGESLSLKIGDTHFSDPDGDDLSYAIRVNGKALPSWMTFNTATGALKIVPGARNTGDYEVTVTASDGSLKTSDTFMLSVEHPLTSGDAIRLSNNRIAENASFGKLIGTLSGKDGDGDAFVSFALGTNPDKMFRIVDGNLVVNSNARFDFETQSHYSVRIKATDDEGTTVQKTFMIAVADVREDPVGTRGNDNLHGDAKNNIIDGKLGNDKLTGGDGADTFVFGKDYGKDVILDFDRAEGDRIDLSNAAGIDGYRDLISHHVRDMGEDLRITASDGSILTIKDMDLNALSKSMFDF
ncbi:MAG: hypothetical protein RLZZ444_4410 [Pseudomonadota bacterium]|jgi:VCBS repeat-containing protein